MKVIMIKDLKKVGKRGEIVEISDGYASNFVIPQGYGRKLTENSLGDYKKEKEKAEEAALIAQKKAAAQEVAKKLEGITLEFQATSGKNGLMIGQISPKQIEEELKSKYDIVIDKRKFIDRYPCNAYGTTSLKIELFKGVVGVVKVHISEKAK